MPGVAASIGRAAAQGRRWFVASTLLAATFAWFAPANAQLNILITKPAARPVPIAVVPFGWQGSGAVAFDLAAVVTADLRSTGRFNGHLFCATRAYRLPNAHRRADEQANYHGCDGGQCRTMLACELLQAVACRRRTSFDEFVG